jgi:hypothetical protein
VAKTIQGFAISPRGAVRADGAFEGVKSAELSVRDGVAWFSGSFAGANPKRRWFMSSSFRPDPAEFERCVSRLCIKIEKVAIREGVSDADCSDLEGTLAAMPPLVRDRVKMMLHGIHIQAEYKDPAMSFAARYVLRLAEDMWDENPHPLTHPTSLPPLRRKQG